MTQGRILSFPAFKTQVGQNFWSGQWGQYIEFDVPVRFDTDELAISMDSFDAGSWNNIPLIEVRI